ncbi:MAG: hypothetical protein IKA76_04470 [Clostridia bacterium]|nr:hypothetical protein [Clostridia bacterium]
MKKLISVVLAVLMLVPMFAYVVPASATGATQETIYAADFTGMDGTYTLAELATRLNWKLVRGDDKGTAVIADGKLTLTAGDLDIVYEVVNDARLTANHTIQYDMVKFYQGGNLRFAGMYTGTDNGETVKAIIDRTTFENYNNMHLVDGLLNEKAGNAGGTGILIGNGNDQVRPETIPGGGDSNTWKVVYDVTNNQVDAYASGARIMSTFGTYETADAWAAVKVSDYVGNGAYIRVQTTGWATFDNISIVAGGEAVSYGEYAYYQDFNDVTYDATTETPQDLAEKIGFQFLKDTVYYQNNSSKESWQVKYSIVDGALDIFVPATAHPSSAHMHTNMGQFGALFVPEMDIADTVVIEYDMSYVNTNQENEFNGGDNPLMLKMYGRRSDFFTSWAFTQKGWLSWSYTGWTNGDTGKGTKFTKANGGPARPEGITYNNQATSYTFGNGAYHMTLVGSTEHIKVVMSMDGMEIYVNDIIAYRLTGTELANWTSGGKTADDIIGNLLQFFTIGGCHVRLDNLKITTDPETKASGLLITEAGANGVTNGQHEYLEVYNNSDKALNIYDYAIIASGFNTYFNPRQSKAALWTKNIGQNEVILAYPGAHTFNSIKKDETTGASLYSITHTNPAYEEGWIQPGEVALLWNTTNAMHNSGYNSPTDINWTQTVDSFRAGQGANAADCKVFMFYNDYNHAFSNSGNYVIALMDRDTFQPGFDPATGEGDQAIVSAPADLRKADSFVNVNAYADNVDKRGHYTASTIPLAKYDYLYNTEKIDGIALEGTVIALGAANMTPGILEDNQKRALTVTVDGKAHKVYLGAEISPVDFIDAAGYNKLMWAVVDGKIVDANAKFTVTKDMTIELGGQIALTTLKGASTRINYYAEDEDGNPIGTGLRWITAVKEADLDALWAIDGVADVEIGTLVARAAQLAENEQTLVMDNVTEDGSDGKVVRKVVAYNGDWYTTSTDYEGFGLFAGGVGNLRSYNYSADYSAVGYVTVTLESGEVFTVYGDYNADDHDRNAIEVIEHFMAEYEAWEEDNTLPCSVTPEDYERLSEYLSYAE